MDDKTAVSTEEALIPEQHSKGSTDQSEGHSPFPIVGVGASAGGLEAFGSLLGGLSSTTGMAFVLIQHLDPTHESSLRELLAKRSPLPVVEAANGMAVRKDHVYVIPPNVNMAISNGILLLTPRPKDRGPHLPVDYWFRSLAEDQRGRAIGVILSGTGSDGTLGLCEIKAVGGITFAQEAGSARHSGMPLSAQNSGCVDFVLPPEGIAARLMEVAGHPYLAPARIEERATSQADPEFKRILGVIRASTGVDFSLYRDTTIKRRIMRRMALHRLNSWEEYRLMLQANGGEVEELYHDLLINVTSFFRDAAMFESLKTHVFPEIVRDRNPSDPIRVWVPGCSTGQEAYSLAMALLEFFDDRPVKPSIQVFATDLSDQKSLDRARAGVYPESIEAEVSPERLRRFFRREDHVYRINKDIRDSCVFARQNVTSDPPFSHLDLVSCRNVLIYLSTPLQKRVLPTFHYALNVPGFLLLGNAETVGEFTDLFDLVDRSHKIYSKKGSTFRLPPHFDTDGMRGLEPPSTRRFARAPQAPSDFQREADRVLLGRYAPAGVLVNDSFEILQFRGRTSPYLEPAPGEPTTNLLKMAREGLFLGLRSALGEARKSRRPTQRENVRVVGEGTIHDVTLEVIPIAPPGGSEACFLVLFHESAVVKEAPPPIKRPAAGADERDAANEPVVTQLRQELVATKEYLQSLAEQQDAANEELRSANEEILSSNEELQSTNEELETAKEELQSANEELTTVNEQLQHRNQELTRVNNDLTNLMSSTTIPVIMVGADLKIRRFTAPARRVMSILPTDVGRPIGDIKHALMVPDLEALLLEVIETVQSIEREAQDREGRWYTLRLHPYRTPDNRVEGAVLVVVDTDLIHKDQEILRHQSALLDLSLDAIIIRDAGQRITLWNRGAEVMYGWTAAEVQGKSMNEVLAIPESEWGQMGQDLDQDSSWEGEVNMRRRDGSAMIIHSREILLRPPGSDKVEVMSIQRDVTERHRTMEALKVADRRKNEFLATLAHELRNPLSPIRNAVEILRLSADDPLIQAEARDVLSRQVRQMSRIVEDLIDVSRIVEKKIDLQIVPIPLATVVETAVESCRSMIEGLRHRLHVSMPPRPVTLIADAVRLSQVLVNLLRNAAKYTPPGGDIWLSGEVLESHERPIVSTDPPSRQVLVLRVRDNGVGIAPDFLPRIFDIFAQGDTAPEVTRSGLGIGLSLVKSLVQMHAGEVTVNSGGMRGTEFTLTLPIVAAPSELRGRRRQQEPASPMEPPSRRLLIVDDNRDQADSLAMLLRLQGHTVEVAYDGRTGLKMVLKSRPDVALLDIGMPELNGYEVARRIREMREVSDLLLIAQTGWGQDEDRQRSEEAGFDFHLVKPIDMDVLRQLLAGRPQSSS